MLNVLSFLGETNVVYFFCKKTCMRETYFFTENVAHRKQTGHMMRKGR